ncbi:Uncharacterized protein HZ326_14405 [Fusarium oxysporum f. sp. albedinis]|nr:Uncharacterized protein HZ326_14405 [Fusarium oxysporum f. sp. albedinis]
MAPYSLGRLTSHMDRGDLGEASRLPEWPATPDLPPTFGNMFPKSCRVLQQDLRLIQAASTYEIPENALCLRMTSKTPGSCVSF